MSDAGPGPHDSPPPTDEPGSAAAPGTDEPTGDAPSSGEAEKVRAAWPARVLLLGIAVVGWGLDQLSKAWVLHALEPGVPVDVVGTFVRFTLVRNPGAAFSLGVNYTFIFTGIATVAALVILVALLPRTRHLGWATAFGLLLAGVLGNLTDRILREPGPLRGHVIDFIQLPHYAIFNIADMCVTTAAVLIVILSIFVNVTLAGHRVRSERSTEDDR